MTTSQDFVSIQFRGKSHTVPLDPGSATCSDLLAALQQSIPGLAPETLKVLVSKPRTRSVQLLQQPGLPLSDAGLHPGSRCLLLGSFTSELQDLQDNKKAEASLRLADFDHEAQQVRLRSNSRSRNINTPPGAHCFGGFQVLPLPVGAGTTVPPPAAALSLLHQLAADPAVVHVMKQHHWKVGLLSEMPAAGRVGVSAVCILGYNVNQGQEISLRLRTDDYRGFRKYLRIRETLMHELAHMVYSDHDNNFKALNSQLLKEVASFETAAAARGGRTLVGGGVFDDHWLGQQQQQQQGAAAAVAQGHTLGGVSTAAGSSLMAARQAAAAAALTRWQQQPQVTDTQSVLEAISLAAADSGPIPSAVVDEAMKQAGAEQPSTAAAAAAADWVQDDSPSDDPFTAAAEEQMRKLGSMEEQQQQQHHHQQQQQQQQHGSQEHVQQAEGDKQQQQHEQLSNLKSVKQQQQQSVEDVKTFSCTSDATSCAGVIHLEDHLEHVAVEPAAAVAAANDMTEGCVDDVVADKLQQVQMCLQQLEQQANSNNTAALQGVQGVLSSIVQHPHEPKYRRLRCNNAVYQRRIGQYPAAVQLLKLAGFSQQQQEWVPTAGPEAVMVYVRDDPGLLWLVLSVVRERLE